MPNFGNSTAPSLGNVLRWLAKFQVILGMVPHWIVPACRIGIPSETPSRGFQIQHSRATNGMFCCWQTNKRCSVSASHFGQNEMSEPLTTTLLMWDGSQWVSILLLTVSSGQSPFSRYIPQASPTSETFAEVFFILCPACLQNSLYGPVYYANGFHTSFVDFLSRISTSFCGRVANPP